MAYVFYLGDMMLPVTPAKLTMKINNQNETMTLINEGEVNLLKDPGLTDIEFDMYIPQQEVPYAQYENGFQGAFYFMERIKELKTQKRPFQFIVTRTTPGGAGLFDTNMKVSLEEYQIKEDAKEGLDLVVSIDLKQYRDYSVKTCQISSDSVKLQTNRDAGAGQPDTSNGQTYTVQKGDCLWEIAKKYYGNGSDYQKIFGANRDQITNPNLIYPGQVLTIPAG